MPRPPRSATRAIRKLPVLCFQQHLRMYLKTAVTSDERRVTSTPVPAARTDRCVMDPNNGAACSPWRVRVSHSQNRPFVFNNICGCTFIFELPRIRLNCRERFAKRRLPSRGGCAPSPSIRGRSRQVVSRYGRYSPATGSPKVRESPRVLVPKNIPALFVVFCDVEEVQ